MLAMGETVSKGSAQAAMGHSCTGFPLGLSRRGAQRGSHHLCSRRDEPGRKAFTGGKRDPGTGNATAEDPESMDAMTATSEWGKSF